MKDAIEKALKGGWSPKLECGELVFPIVKTIDNGGFMARIEEPHTLRTLDWSYPISKYRIVNDKKFWKALGVQQGWEEWDKYRPEGNTLWKKYWHSFIDHMADGGDINEFFNNLLK